MNSIVINNTDYPVKIYLENRKSYRASIGRKAINIRISKFLPKSEQNKQIKKLLTWASQRIKKDPEAFKQFVPKKYENREKLRIVDKEYTIIYKYKNKKTGSAKIVNNDIILLLPNYNKELQSAELISALISKCIAIEYLPLLKELLHELNNKYFKKKIGKVFLKNNKSIWGSCSVKNNINISSRLLFAPKNLLKYVCIHELAHLIERNHSKRFWALIENAMPDYKEMRKWLKMNRNKYWF